ncbi:hypothetical protein COV23_02205 [Candidatus Wolfebacteria bacterium CG10_big_fil_rev_8_21_14_0_10_31_9]|uniref:GGDEF domain-containing protein n=1 Tax=Candidatus Wolfebacteria bacterium CG10_big_fil_rev_8_21_14_0_10_31_9 TaxID=1975070 RepID=A0A2H0RC03_9BACT|nr:MAG: hypothetical protein COV23_02205 [Candidatus Wolfebacteria bacterium CG10_big_fil_rev_8_21_14_0_10_31_9]
MKLKIKNLKSELFKLEKIISNQEKEIKRLCMLTESDFLTGLYNRRGFTNEAEKFLASLKKPKLQKEHRKFTINNFSIIFIDLDNLKLINDIYGHKKGDEFLKSMAEILKKTLRGIDIPARWGGDEFVVGLVNSNEKEAYKVAQKIKSQIAKIKIKHIPKKFKFSASFGVISSDSKKHKQISNLYELIEKADMTMYKAKKEKGKDFIMVFS